MAPIQWSGLNYADQSLLYNTLQYNEVSWIMLTSLYKTEAVNRIQQHRPYNQLASLNQSVIRPSLNSNGKGLQIMKILHISANNQHIIIQVAYNQLASLNQSVIRPSLNSNGKGLQIMKILHISANNQHIIIQVAYNQSVIIFVTKKLKLKNNLAHKFQHLDVTFQITCQVSSLPRRHWWIYCNLSTTNMISLSSLPIIIRDCSKTKRYLVWFYLILSLLDTRWER